MKRSSTLFLKLAGILMGIPVLALGIFVLPQIEAICKALDCQPGDILEYQRDIETQG